VLQQPRPHGGFPPLPPALFAFGSVEEGYNGPDESSAAWLDGLRSAARTYGLAAFALRAGHTTAAADNGGTPCSTAEHETKLAEQKIAREPKLQTKKSGRGPPTKATPSAQDPTRGPEKDAAGASEAKYNVARCWARAASSSSCAFPASAAFRGTSYRRAGALRLHATRRGAAPRSDAPGRPHLTQARAALQHHVGETKAGRLDLEAGLRPAPLLVLPAGREHVAPQGSARGPGLLLDGGGRRAVCEVAACVEIKILRRVRPLIFSQVAADQRPAGQDRRRGRGHAAASRRG
jgi:hypothetical protein